MSIEVIDAFTWEYDDIQNQLKNELIVEANGKRHKAMVVWDTGATNSCISKEFAVKLGLSPVDRIILYSSSGFIYSYVYLVDIIFSNSLRMDNIQVPESAIGTQRIDMLIGMDIINRGDIAVSNGGGKTVLTFRVPSSNPIDFCKDDE